MTTSVTSFDISGADWSGSAGETKAKEGAVAH
jgi:hypothetical protein